MTGKDVEKLLDTKLKRHNMYYEIQGDYGIVTYFGDRLTIPTRFRIFSDEELEKLRQNPYDDYEAYGAREILWVDLRITKHVWYKGPDEEFVEISYRLPDIVATKE